jgi:hypothetical protein
MGISGQSWIHCEEWLGRIRGKVMCGMEGSEQCSECGAHICVNHRTILVGTHGLHFECTDGVSCQERRVAARAQRPISSQ